MKKTNYLTIISAVVIGVSGSSLPVAAENALYVSPNGNDKESGTSPDNAVKTIERARDIVRAKKYNVDMKADFTVYLRGGRYELNETLYFDYRDSGSNDHYVNYKAYKNEEPVICGGRKVSEWKPVAGKPYFVASVPERTAVKRKSSIKDNRKLALHPKFYSLQKLSDDGFASYFAQLYVNGVRAEIARSHDAQQGSRKGWWDNPDTKEFRDGVYIKKSAIKNYSNPEDMRLLWLNLFKTMDAPVETIIPCADNKDEVIFKMRQPDFLKGTSWHRINPNGFFFIVNALEELDEPGEWYLDQKQDKVYYYPCQRDGDLNKAEVYAPRVEGLMKIDGTPMRQVHHLRFEGITFQHGNWAARKDHYLGLSQAEIFKTYTSEFPGQVILNYADDVMIRGCVIRHMASCGIQLYEGCDNVLIEGNITHDTTGAGISIGRWWLHKWECPTESICTKTMIRNNIVRNVGRDYWQGTGINIFTAYDCKVYHNDVSDIAYTALHARTGDSNYIHPKIGKIEYKYNKVSRAFAGHKWGIADGGHLYMHGRYPDSLVEGNYSLHANKNVNLEYYADNDSHTILWTKNVSRYSLARTPFRGNCFTRVVFKNNYSDRALRKAGKGIEGQKREVQWPPEALEVMKKAGLQTDYQHLLGGIYGHDNLALGKVCKSSSDADGQNSAVAAADGDWGTYWRANDQSEGRSWWAVDLGKAYVIQHLSILPRQDKYEAQARKMLEIQASNDPTFKKHIVLAERNELPWYNKGSSNSTHPSNLWEQFINVPEGYRYLRVISTDPKGKLSIGEFSAFGYPEKQK